MGRRFKMQICVKRWKYKVIIDNVTFINGHESVHLDNVTPKKKNLGDVLLIIILWTNYIYIEVD